MSAEWCSEIIQQTADWLRDTLFPTREGINHPEERGCLFSPGHVAHWRGHRSTEPPPLTRSTCLRGWHKYKQQAAERESTLQGSEERVCWRPSNRIVAEKSSNNWMHCFSDVLNPSASAGVAHILYLHMVPSTLQNESDWSGVQSGDNMTWQFPALQRFLSIFGKIQSDLRRSEFTWRKRFQSWPKYEEAACEQ